MKKNDNLKIYKKIIAELHITEESDVSKNDILNKLEELTHQPVKGDVDEKLREEYARNKEAAMKR